MAFMYVVRMWIAYLTARYFLVRPSTLTRLLTTVQVPDFAIVASNGPGVFLCTWYCWRLFPIIEDPADKRLCQLVLVAGLVLLAGEQVCTVMDEPLLRRSTARTVSQ